MKWILLISTQPEKKISELQLISSSTSTYNEDLLMLITFSCDHFENIVMFEAVAKKLLILMGHSATVPGALLAYDVPQALQRLEAGIEGIKKTAEQNTPQSTNMDDEDEKPEVSLAHRAIPLINMLNAALKHNCVVMWN